MPRGGSRPGAGRKAGSKNALPLTAIKTIDALKTHRCPEGISDELREIYGRAVSTVVAVMDGNPKVMKKSPSLRLQAAKTIIEHIATPVTQQVEHGGNVVHIHVETGVPRPDPVDVTPAADLLEEDSDA